jgi:hypothetical protein
MIYKLVIGLIVLLSICNTTFAQQQDTTLKIAFLRHGEKPKKGSNLTCAGFNRSLQLPSVIEKKFGVPSAIYVSALALGTETKHCRMFETAVPLAVKFNITLNTNFEEKEAARLSGELLKQKGTVLVIWEHKAIAPIVNALGISKELVWEDTDYDSIWIVSFDKGVAHLTKDIEGITPSDKCPM